MTRAILAIDQGTTNSKAILVNEAGAIVARGSALVGLALPHPGWVEQDPLRIWASVQEAIAACLAAASQSAQSSGQDAVQIVALAISNQRESVTLWDGDSAAPLGPVISWQCRRTAQACADLAASGHGARVQQLTGLPLDPMFPGPKMRWLLDRAPLGANLRLGTIDAWLIHCLTGGALHACDASNAARSQLYDLNTQSWSAELSALFGVPLSALPQVRNSADDFGVTRGVRGLPDGIPIRAAIGDSHAALFGHGAHNAGDGKVTFGTGSSVMTTIDRFVAPQNGITTTIAWALNGRATYAFEGNILVSAAALPWMVDLLGLPDVQSLTDLAQTAAPDGPSFVPAFVGLGAPHWAPDARALFAGITFNTSRAQMARAVTDSIALQVQDVFAAMAAQSPVPIAALFADGGPSQNQFLMQCVADILDHPLICCDAPEASALGAAYLAGLSIGLWPDLATIQSLPRAARTVTASSPPDDRSRRLRGWRDGLARATFSIG